MKTIIAEDPETKIILETARKAAKTYANVLITGETGVGKEVIARFIHDHSLFSDGPFITINCAALPDNMIEAILFGYEKGSFTNAITSYIGKFEQSQNGTLLLDEISEIPLELQGKLLRVLQEREIERLGGKKMISINNRIIAATNRNLLQQVTKGYFRKDLYYRLNVLPIHCPALRNRRLDILPFAEYFMNHHAQLLGRDTPHLTELAKKKLINSKWPGNIREMDNVIQRTLILTEKNIIDHHDIVLMEDIFEESEQQMIRENSNTLNSRLKQNEAQIIIDALNETEGSRNIAARKLNMSPRTLRYKISKLKSIGVKIP